MSRRKTIFLIYFFKCNIWGFLVQKRVIETLRRLVKKIMLGTERVQSISHNIGTRMVSSETNWQEV